MIRIRLWHYELLPYLDDFHIVAQWRELLAIKGAIDKKGTPNHRLVNKVLDYPIQDFKTYTVMVVKELINRKIRFDFGKYREVLEWECDKFNTDKHPADISARLVEDLGRPLYEGWHNDRYLTQCYYNLQEKYDCGIVSASAWGKICEFYSRQKSKITWVCCDDVVATIGDPKLDIEEANKRLEEFYKLYKGREKGE